MPYVLRDQSGNIAGLFANQQDDVTEYLPDDDHAVTAFILAALVRLNNAPSQR